MDYTIELDKIFKAVFDKRIDYILRVVKTQGFLPSARDLYGDGSLWNPLTYAGYLIFYESIKEVLQLKGRY